jgi:Tfp pilus assembly protein PilV
VSRRETANAGFSTIEVLAALAIVASLMLPLMSIQLETARAHQRNEHRYAFVRAERSLLEFMRHLNPMQRPEGVLVLEDGLEARWTARAITDVQVSTQYPTGDGAFKIAMYEITITFSRTGSLTRAEAVPPSIELRQVGWEPIGVTTNSLLGQNPELGVP